MNALVIGLSFVQNLTLGEKQMVLSLPFILFLANQSQSKTLTF